MGQVGLIPHHGDDYSAEAQNAEKKEKNSDAFDKRRVIGFVDFNPAYEKGKHDPVAAPMLIIISCRPGTGFKKLSPSTV